MSYKYEKTESGVDLVIAGWEKGIGDSALLGHQQMQNVDILSIPGVIQAGWKSNLVTSTASLVTWMRRDPLNSGEIYAVTSGGIIHKGATIISWSILTGTPTNNGSGLGIWKNYLMLSQATGMQAAQLPVTNASTWYPIDTAPSTPMTLISSSWHPVFTGVNTDELFIGNTRFLARVTEVPHVVFDPNDTATYLANNNVLDLPTGNTIQTIEALGNNLYLGTFQGTNPGDRMSAIIFPWNKVSDSFDNAIISVGTGAHQLKTIGSQIYTFIGNRSDVSTTNGSQTTLLKTFYNIFFPNASQLTDIRPDAIDALTNQEILIGIGNISGNINPLGIYSLREGIHILKNIPSTGNSGNIKIGSILALDAQKYLFSWSDDTTGTFGIDLIGNNGRYADYSAQIDTDIIPTATSIYPKNYGQIEFKLASILKTGQGIKIWYRTDLQTSFTQIGTGWTFASIGAKMSYVDTANIDLSEWIQFRIQLAANADSNDSPQLREIRLRQ